MKMKMNMKKIAAVTAAVVTIMAAGAAMATPAYAAAGMNQITEGLNNITSLLKTVVSGAGVIATILSIVQLARAIPAHETTQISGAVLGIVAGMIMALNPLFLSMLGL